MRLAISYILSALALSACTMAIDNCGGTTVSYSDLPQEVQDSIYYWVKHDIVTTFPASFDTTRLTIIDKPHIISFDGPFTLEDRRFGPWTIHQVLTRTSDGKEFVLSHNIPTPVIIRDDILIVPVDYNILTVWNPSAQFTTYRLR
ncbi:MAG: hypothetical protein K2L27_01895 [Muribaculaceae bacterium]|nr:hypothetical protein [Muribaculaceae bacterium]